MVEMFSERAPLKGHEWVQVTETKFERFCDSNCLVRWTNGKIREYYDCEKDAVTAIAELHQIESGWTDMFYVMQEKKK